MDGRGVGSLTRLVGTQVPQFLDRLQHAVGATYSLVLQCCHDGARVVSMRLVRARHHAATAFTQSPAGAKVHALRQSVDQATADLPEVN